MCSRLDTPKSLLTPRDRSKSRHNDPTVIKHCQNVRLTSAKLPVKFQLDCWKIKTNFPWACIHGFGSTWLAVFRDGQKTPSTYGSSFPPNDPTVIKHCQIVRLTSAKLPVKFQLDCWKIKTNFPWACIHGFDQPDSQCFGMDKKLLALMVLAFLLMIRQSSNFVRICASPARNGTSSFNLIAIRLQKISR